MLNEVDPLALLEACYILYLHLDNEIYASFVLGTNVKQCVFQRFDAWGLVGVENFDVLNFFEEFKAKTAQHRRYKKRKPKASNV
ncbi:MAG: hypothetical protein AAF702_40745 [Chloroflexota bacterium]